MQTFIADTANVTLRRKRDKHVVFTAEAQLAGLTGSEESEVIRGGIGNKALYTVKHSKEVVLAVRNATFNLEFLAMSQGAEIDPNGKALITKTERNLEVKEGAITLAETPEGKVTISQPDGTTTSVDAEGKEVTVDGVNDGTITASYKTEVEGRKITLDATKFSESYEVEYATIEYNTETNEVVRDIYFVFNNANPAGDYEINLENGEAYTPELEFNAMAEANSNEIGYIIEVDRVKGETP